MYRKFTAPALLALAGLAHADGTANWKLYAFSATKPQAAMFYLNSEILRTPGHVQVWMKALAVKKLEDRNDVESRDKKSALIQNTIHLVAQSYQSPLSTVETLTKEQTLMVILYEQIADEGLIDPTIKILYEIDCSQKLIRGLSITLPTASDNKVREWEHVPPETTLATLSKLTCKP